MSEETPRLSRREMRERGLLKAVADDNTPSLSETQELHLRRLSRKEMREREKASRSAVQAEIDSAAKAREAQAGPSQESVTSDDQDNAQAANGELAAQPVVAPDPDRKSVFERFAKTEEKAEPEPEGSLEDRLLARVRKDSARGTEDADVSSPDVDEAVKSYVAAIPSLDAQSPAATEAPEVTPASTPEQSAPAPEPYEEARYSEFDEESEEKPGKQREGIGAVLMTVIMILIAILLGFLIGWAVNHFWLYAEGVPSSLTELHTSLQI
ncbi:hypothetical protein I6E29_07420 [Arcanobacterium haemolyticum]|nr:hypothetical protein [Arcanobacterium haemolyticum]